LSKGGSELLPGQELEHKFARQRPKDQVSPQRDARRQRFWTREIVQEGQRGQGRKSQACYLPQAEDLRLVQTAGFLGQEIADELGTGLGGVAGRGQADQCPGILCRVRDQAGQCIAQSGRRGMERVTADNSLR